MPENRDYKVTMPAEFPADRDGKPTAMHFIIRDQAGMAEYWEGNDFLVTACGITVPFKLSNTQSR